MERGERRRESHGARAPNGTIVDAKQGMGIMVFAVANAWECSWIILKGTPSFKGTIMMSVFVCLSVPSVVIQR